MAIFSQEIILFLKHLLGTFVAAALMLAAAIGLAYVEKWCVANQMPAYLCIGATMISFSLLTIDAIVVCGTAAIVAFRMLQKTWQHEH